MDADSVMHELDMHVRREDHISQAEYDELREEVRVLHTAVERLQKRVAALDDAFRMHLGMMPAGDAP